MDIEDNVNFVIEDLKLSYDMVERRRADPDLLRDDPDLLSSIAHVLEYYMEYSEYEKWVDETSGDLK